MTSDTARRKLAGRGPASGRFPSSFWLAAIVVTGIGLVLRLINLSHPKDLVFDELYYANEAWDLLQRGVEWNPEDNTAQYVVHPPLGKWMIAAGEQLFGFNSFGWRIMAVLAGTATILLVTMAAWRLLRSTVLAATAGLLMSLDGMHFVLSRVALLDIFLLFWIIVAFYLLVLDREQYRARLLTGNTRRIRGYRIACAVALGLACGVKWSGLWYVLLFAAAAAVFDMSARRSAGEQHWIRRGTFPGIVWGAGTLGIVVVTYLTTWWGWFASDDGYLRHWYRDSNGRTEDRFIDPLVNLFQYHRDAFGFHTTLSSGHPYQSEPWQWLVLGRPVAFYRDTSKPCDAASCIGDITLLGTPVLWWSFIPALLALGWLAIARRDGRAWLIMAGALASILPWFQSQLADRTMFYFYALPAEPFLVLAVVYVLGAIIGPPRTEHRVAGSIVAGAYVLLVALCFAYFYPIYAGVSLPYEDWLSRMWLDGRWM